jgi:signal peptidase
LVSRLIKNIVRDVVIVFGCLTVIWIGLQVYHGATQPFYIVSDDAMYPELKKYDIIVITGHKAFEDVKVGDIIVFDRPKDHNKVIVQRVAAIVDDDPRVLKTKGGNPITEKEYIGTVIHVIPGAGYITKILQPPIIYIMIAAIVGIIVVVEKQILKNKNKKKTPKTQPKTFGVKPPKKGPTTPPPIGKPSSTDGPSTYGYFECPNCHEPRKLEQNPDGSQFCPECGQPNRGNQV